MRALMRFDAIMPIEMQLQLILATKCLMADVTFEWAIVTMRSHVFGEIFVAVKMLAANVARE